MILVKNPSDKLLNCVSAFGTPSYLKAGGDEYGWFVDEGQNYVLSFYVRKFYFARTIILASLDKIDIENKIYIEAIDIDHIVAYCKDALNIDYIMQSGLTAIFPHCPDGAKFAPFGTYKIDLTLSLEDLFAGLHRNYKTYVRKLNPSKLEVRSDINLMQDAVNVINVTHALNDITPCNADVIREFFYSEKSRILPFVASHEGIDVAAIILVFSEKKVHYYFGGMTRNAPQGSMVLLHWKAIQMFKSMGYLEYDLLGARVNPLAGSKLDGIKSFKRRFGGSFDQGFLWKKALNWKGILFSSLLQIRGILRSKPADIIDSENK